MRIRFVLILSTFIIYTFYKSVQLWPAQGLIAIFLAVFVFAIMLGGMIIYRTHISVFDKNWFQIVTWLGSLLMGFWATFIIISFPVDIIRLVTFIWNYASGASEGQIEQQSVLFYDANIFIFALSGVLSSFGFLMVLRGPKVKQTTVKIQNLSLSLKGLRIAQISDLHVGPTIRKRYVQKVVHKTNQIQPDIVVLTGDIVDAHSTSVTAYLNLLKDLKSRYGIFYVTGNHEYYWDAETLIKKMEDLGITSLLNENALIQIGDSQLMMAGVTDPTGGHMLLGHAPDINKALASQKEAQFKILLAHRPDACFEAEKRGVNLQISGHTHSGQFFPFSLFIGLVHKYSRGLYRHKRMWLYVNPGTGYWGPANRLGIRSEISLIVLEPS